MKNVIFEICLFVMEQLYTVSMRAPLNPLTHPPQEKHFPSVIKEIQPYRFPSKARSVLAPLFQTVCEAIEDYHGRLTPNVHDGHEYNRNRTKYQQAQIFEKHIDESMGLKFTEVIDRKLIAETLKRFGEAGDERRGSRSPPPHREAKKLRRSLEDDDDDVMIVTRKERNSLDSISSISSGSVVAISPTRSR
jgi:zinc finger CCCH domain-containing protein 13